MSAHTKTRHTKIRRNPTKRHPTKKKTPWRDVAKKEIARYSEAGVMLRGCRDKLAITQVELAKVIKINQHHISEMENGKRSIGKEMAKRFAAFFKVDYRVFL